MNKPPEKFPFEGERGDALIALLGPKVLRRLRTLLRLAAPRHGETDVVNAQDKGDTTAAEMDKAA